MKERFRAPTEEEQGFLIALAAMVFGAWARLIVPAEAGFPVNDGGLFYSMIKALQANAYRLPQFVQYNGLQIPYVYPPLGFYVGGLVSGLLRVDPLVVLQWIPAIASVLSIVPVYLLAREYRGNALFAGIATLIFALTPRVTTWQLMGGGITRSFGVLFLTAALYSLYALFTKGLPKHLVLAIIFSALLVLSHPEATIHAIALGLVLWTFKGRSLRSAIHAGLVAAAVILLTAPWWATILVRFGLGPVLSGAQAGQQDLRGLATFPLMRFTEEPTLTPIAFLAVLGVVTCLSKKDFLLPTLLVVPAVVEPRFASTPEMIPLALLAAIGLLDVVMVALARMGAKAVESASSGILHYRANQWILAYLALYFVINMYIADSRLWPVRLTPADKTTFAWIRDHTPPQSRFVILTGGREIFADPIQEWFPVLTDRISETTIQGREWMGGPEFAQAGGNIQFLQGCMNSDTALECLAEVTGSAGIPYDYIMVARHLGIIQNARLIAEASQGDGLIAELQSNAEFDLVYRTADFVIFFHKSDN